MHHGLSRAGSGEREVVLRDHGVRGVNSMKKTNGEGERKGEDNVV